MTPIRHKACGGQVAWYTGGDPKVGDICSADTFVRMDGSRPTRGQIFNEKCPCCGEHIPGPLALSRDGVGKGVLGE